MPGAHKGAFRIPTGVSAFTWKVSLIFFRHSIKIMCFLLHQTISWQKCQKDYQGFVPASSRHVEKFPNQQQWTQSRGSRSLGFSPRNVFLFAQICWLWTAWFAGISHLRPWWNPHRVEPHHQKAQRRFAFEGLLVITMMTLILYQIFEKTGWDYL